MENTSGISASLKCSITVDMNLDESTLQFSVADDLASSVVVDLYYFNNIKTHKIHKNLLGNLVDNVDFQASIKKIMQNFIRERLTNEIKSTTIQNLMTVLKSIIPETLKISSQILKYQLKSYLDLVHPNSGFSLELCNRYPNDINQGVTIKATKLWHKNSILSKLNGRTTNLSGKDLKYLSDSGLNYSILSKSKKVSQLWLGVGTFANHDCSPNARIYGPRSGGVYCLQAVRDILPGEEVTWYYGAEYFDINCCKCLTCEAKIETDSTPLRTKSEKKHFKDAFVQLDYLPKKVIKDYSFDNESIETSNDISSECPSLNMSENTIKELMGAI